MRINTLIKTLKGEVIKKYIDICYFMKIPPGKLEADGVVISLTSYGRRVRDCVPYTLYYFFKQKQKPSRIILWLDYDHWNDDNLPLRLVFLKKYGLEVRYCKDIKSYKKLIYTLKLCPDDKIVTADDDMLYSLNMLRELSILSCRHPDNIIALRYFMPVWEIPSKSFAAYRKWDNTNENSMNIAPMPTTGGGVLFPPHCFNHEVFNEDVYSNLCHQADDVWFWAMAIYSGRKIFARWKDVIIPIDAFYQKFHKGSALEHSNVDENANDRQIKAVFDYYKLWDKVRGLKTISEVDG